MPSVPPAGPLMDEAAVAALRSRIKRLRRRVLDPSVLRGLMPIRLPLARTAAAAAPVVAREQEWRATSPAYAAAVTSLDAPLARAQTTSVDSLAWWVPLAVPDDPVLVARALQHQDFPYRAITQAREVALGGAMIDLGANVGRMSIPRLVLGDVTTAYCAEPDLLNFDCLVRNVHSNGLSGLVLPDQIAIGARDGTATLVRARSAGGHRVIAGEVPRRAQLTEVPMARLDSWVSRTGIDLDRVCFVKMDVQGSELDVLEGAAGVLARKHIAWQVEIDPATLATRQRTVGELLSVLRGHFTHFIDLNRDLTTARVRPVTSLEDGLAYLSNSDDGGRTDILLFTLDDPPDRSRQAPGED